MEDDQQQLADLVRITLGRAGIEADDVDIGVIGAVERVYGPKRDALLAADLSDVMPEFGVNPGSPPTDPEGRKVHGQ